MRTTNNEQPYPLRGCYVCGSNVQVKTNDPFLLKVLDGNRSFNFCTHHLNVLLKYASLEVIDLYRREILVKDQIEITYNRRYDLKRIIQGLEWLVQCLAV